MFHVLCLPQLLECLKLWNVCLLKSMDVQVVYKKLLNGTVTLEDLHDAHPTLARGLQSLLNYDGDDVEVVFCRTFEVEYQVLDMVRCCQATLCFSLPILHAIQPFSRREAAACFGFSRAVLPLPLNRPTREIASH